MRVEGARAACWRARARACSTRAKHITPGPPVKRHLRSIPAFSKLEIRIKNASRNERRAWREAKVISTPLLLPPRLFIFHKSLSKRAQYFGIIGNGSVGQERGGRRREKKNKKIIIKMSHRESPMSRKSERKKRERKKKFGNIIKIRWKPPVHHPFPTRRPVFHTSSSSSEVHLSRLSWSNSPYTNIHFDRIQRA